MLTINNQLGYKGGIPPALTIIGIDPGATCGVCAVGVSDRKVGLYSDSCENLYYRLEDWPDGYVTLVVERFILYPNRAQGQAMADLETPEIIGVLKFIAARRGWNIYLQTAAQVKPWATDETVTTMPWWSIGPEQWKSASRHARDAARHAAYFINFTLPDLAAHREKKTRAINPALERADKKSFGW